jgi:hypothetical protein
MDELRDRLKKKGWSEEEIEKTIKIFEKAEEEKRPALVLLDKLVYWMGLMLAMVGNFVISVVLIPILITMPAILLYITIIILGTTFGLLFSLIIGDIGNLSKEKIVVANVFIPVIAVINIFIVVNIANFISERFELELVHNPYLVAAFYVTAFSLPHLIQKIQEKIK